MWVNEAVRVTEGLDHLDKGGEVQIALVAVKKLEGLLYFCIQRL